MTRNKFFLWAGLFSIVSIFAQTGFDLQVAVDTTKMRIGEQIEYILQVKADSTSQITFSDQPFFAPFEVIDDRPIDTLRAKSHYLFTKKYALIQFDSGAYWLPPQKVVVNGFSKISDSLLIQVASVPVDTLKQKLFDIKPVAEVEQNFDKLSRSIIYGLLLVLFLLGLIYALFFDKKKKKNARINYLLSSVPLRS